MYIVHVYKISIIIIIIIIPGLNKTLNLKDWPGARYPISPGKGSVFEHKGSSNEIPLFEDMINLNVPSFKRFSFLSFILQVRGSGLTLVNEIT